MSDDVRVLDWVKLLKRARLGRTVKGAAMVLSTFADFETGRKVRPGTARLAHEAEISPELAGRVLAVLCAAGLLEKVGKYGNTDEYRLIIAEDMSGRPGRVPIPDPVQHEQLIEKIRDRERGHYKGDPLRKNLPPVKPGADSGTSEICPGSDWGQNSPSAPASIMEHSESAPGSEPICPQSNRGLPMDRTSTTTSHPDKDLIPNVLVPSGPGREQDDGSPAAVTDPDAGDTSHRCPHGNNRRRCVTCRRETKSGVTTPPDGPTVTTPEPRQPNCEHGFRVVHRTDGQLACPTCRYAAAEAAAEEALSARRRSQPGKEVTA